MTDSRTIQHEILNLLKNEYLRLTPTSLERVVRRKYPETTRGVIRKAVKSLIYLGRLVYTQHYSTTHLEINYSRPFQVSDHIILCPGRCSCSTDSNQVVIKINDGSSFGMGDHPTTQMMLRALDVVLSPNQKLRQIDIRQSLDVGTGSGILAIAAAMLGANKVEAIDIDPLACREATTNASLNGVDHLVNVSTTPLDHFSDNQFDLLMANLRPPTIMKLLPLMTRVSSKKAIWIFSGCRATEKERVVQRLLSQRTDIIWEEENIHWSAVAVRRRSLRRDSLV